MSTAFFLGAGASKAEGAPIQGEIFKEFFKNPSTDTISITKRLKDFFATFFHIDFTQEIDLISFPTFEEVLGIIDVAGKQKDSISGYESVSYNRNGVKSFDQIRKDLILMMTYILDLKLKNSSTLHVDLIKCLNDEGLLSESIFITTNYDILIDNAFRNIHQKIELDYGINFTIPNFNRSKFEPLNNRVELFKLHGSLNWLYCSNCRDMQLTQYEKGVTWLINNNSMAKCRNCNSFRIPIIIPPTYFKDFSNTFLNNIWHQAEVSLRNVEHIIFSGYSLPDSDIHVKYLLKRVQLYRLKKNLPFHITVINNFPNKENIYKTDEAKRYKRFFGEDINYTELSFNDLASSDFIQEFLKNK